MLQTRPRAAVLADTFTSVRAFTEELAAPLSPEDQIIQSMPDASPTKWHRAHTTWFFETFVLAPNLAGYTEVDPSYGYLFNSYYDAVGPRHERGRRGMISRPSASDVADYRTAVDESMVEFLDSVDADDVSVLDLVELGLHHEQQHQELLLMDIKHVLSSTVLRSPYRGGSPSIQADNPAWSWVDFDGGIAELGYDGQGFCFDNEQPVHETLLQPYRLSDRLVTVGDWLMFMDDGGYRRPEFWLSDGWHRIRAEGWEAPSYWRAADDGSWFHYTLDGERPVNPAEPVVHVSFYEADAFARWAGARLPSEAEWEIAARPLAIEGNLLPADHLHPVAVPEAESPHSDGSLRQMYGDVWEWTSSPYIGYPGYKPAAGAVGEYNGKFMIDQQVLRGGCAVTPDGHVRSSYRNFFPAHARWQFGGLRLASDQ